MKATDKTQPSEGSNKNELIPDRISIAHAPNSFYLEFIRYIKLSNLIKSRSRTTFMVG